MSKKVCCWVLKKKVLKFWHSSHLCLFLLFGLFFAVRTMSRYVLRRLRAFTAQFEELRLLGKGSRLSGDAASAQLLKAKKLVHSGLAVSSMSHSFPSMWFFPYLQPFVNDKFVPSDQRELNGAFICQACAEMLNRLSTFFSSFENPSSSFYAHPLPLRILGGSGVKCRRRERREPRVLGAHCERRTRVVSLVSRQGVPSMHD